MFKEEQEHKRGLLLLHPSPGRLNSALHKSQLRKILARARGACPKRQKLPHLLGRPRLFGLVASV